MNELKVLHLDRPDSVRHLWVSHDDGIAWRDAGRVLPRWTIIVSGLNFPGNERLVLELALRKPSTTSPIIPRAARLVMHMNWLSPACARGGARGFPYLVFYVERGPEIGVWRVLHAARDIPEWLTEPSEELVPVPARSHRRGLHSSRAPASRTRRLTARTTAEEEAMTVAEPVHPGEHLAEIMKEMGITQYRLAKTIGVPQVRIHDIVHCRRSITADTALRIGQALGMTPDFWLNLQRMYDLDVARATTDVSAIEPLMGAPRS